MEIDYTKVKKNTVAYALSKWPNNWNKKTTKESNYIKEIMSEVNNIKELPEGIFPVNLKIIDRYQ